MRSGGKKGLAIRRVITQSIGDQGFRDFSFSNFLRSNQGRRRLVKSHVPGDEAMPRARLVIENT